MCIRARYPSRGVVPLLAAYHPASGRQHDLAWRHFPVLPYCLGTFRAQTMLFFSLSFAFAHTTVCYTNSHTYSDRSPVSVDWRLCPFGYDMILCSQRNSSDSGMSGTSRHIRLCHYTPGHRPSNGRVRAFPACLLNIDYVTGQNLSCLHIILPVLYPL